jgi:hypothetical protein
MYRSCATSEKSFAHGWWDGFLSRHKDEIEIRIYEAREATWAALSSSTVLEYFMRLSEVVKELRSTTQVSNMDETGNGIRPEKAHHMLVICSKRASA